MRNKSVHRPVNYPQYNIFLSCAAFNQKNYRLLFEFSAATIRVAALNQKIIRLLFEFLAATIRIAALNQKIICIFSDFYPDFYSKVSC